MADFIVFLFLFIAFSHNLFISIHGRNYTIEGEGDDIIDCVDIYKQPAFKHPLFKNHIIQMKPSSNSPIKRNKSVLQSWNKYKSCPKGTIPISRTNIFNYLKKSKTKTNGTFQFKHEYAKASIQSGGPYYGTTAKLSVWNPTTLNGEISSSQIWVQAGADQYLNSIEAGWLVKAGDNKPRFFIYWTSDNYGSTGCYNLECPGFVQVTRTYAFGAPSTPFSTYNGKQFHMELTIHKDKRSGNWWLRHQTDELGYWPSSIFTSLVESSNAVSWGGKVTNSEPNHRHTSTQMGSGHFPTEGFGKAGFIFDIKYIDGNGKLENPQQLQPIVSYPACYDLDIPYSSDSVMIYYGGPGFTTSGKCL